LRFLPGDFIQVNGAVNRSLIAQAMALLAPAKHERLLDLYCGLGNFTLPLARRVREIVGLEGCGSLVKRAEDNARHNSIGNAQFHQADLTTIEACQGWLRQAWHKLIVDPTRSGCAALVRTPEISRVSRILYVSCNPRTLAEDAEQLVGQQGFHLACAGTVDMFTHTSHAEAIALFVRDG